MRTVSELGDFLELAQLPLLVVDFTASWCGPCRMVAPLYDAMSHRHPRATFIKVDVDAAPDVQSHCAIRAMPTFQIYARGEKVFELVGANVPTLDAELTKLTAALPAVEAAETHIDLGEGSDPSEPPLKLETLLCFDCGSVEKIGAKLSEFNAQLRVEEIKSAGQEQIKQSRAHGAVFSQHDAPHSAYTYIYIYIYI